MFGYDLLADRVKTCLNLQTVESFIVLILKNWEILGLNILWGMTQLRQVKGFLDDVIEM